MAGLEEKVEVKKKRRVVQVAKEFHISVESLVEFLCEKGFNVKSHMKPVTPEMFDVIQEHFGKGVSPAADEAEKELLDINKREQKKLQEEERLRTVQEQIKELVDSKPPTLEEVRKEAEREAEREREKARKAREAEAQKKVAEAEKQTRAQEPEKGKKQQLEEEEKRKKQTRRLERLLSHPPKEEKIEPEEVVTDQVEERLEPAPEQATVEEVPEEVEIKESIEAETVGTEPAPSEEVVEEKTEETKKTGKKKKKKKERIAEEKLKAAQKVDKKKKKKKRERRPKVSQEEVQAAVKKTIQAMEEKGKPRKRKRVTKTEEEVEEVSANVIKVPEFISVADLAQAMDVEPNEVIKKCLSMGLMVSINQRLDMDTIIMVADEFGFTVEQEEMFGMDVIEEIEEQEVDPDKLKPRPPVVTIMGHVDHGKTSLLDYIRKSNIIAGEVGGITQHIGAYVVTVDGKKVTFLDTPGHEAFTAMRARGAHATDIVVLVVAADDSVMPQTVEAINHAKAAGVPIIVAINKIDKPNANPELIKKQLADINMLVEEWGGKYPAVEISAKTGQNVDSLMELLILQAELLELKANPDRLARGVIIESELDKGRGPVATVLVQEGTLKVGDPIVVGPVFGKVRAMFDERGRNVKKAPPSTPVQVLGFDDVPTTGDILYALSSERVAREISIKRQQLQRERDFRRGTHTSLDEFSRRMREGEVKELKLIVKADVGGSVEALCDALQKLSNDEVKVNIIHKGVGSITETDVLLASASDAVIIGFQIRPNAKAWEVAANEDVDIRTYSIIYDAIQDVKQALEGMLEPEEKEELLGVAEVREVFRIPKVGNIAGCYVQNGKLVRNGQARIVREGKVVYEGTINSLKRFKEDVREVQAGYECGVGIENFNDIKVGDSLEVFKIVKIDRVIES